LASWTGGCRSIRRSFGPTSTPPAPARGADPSGVGGSAGVGPLRGGLSTKIHVVSDGRGRPLVTRATAGQAADTTALLGLVDAVRVARSGGVGRPRVRPDYLVADKDYSSRANRAGLHARRIAHTIPERDDQRPSPAAGPSRWPAGGVLPSAVSASQPGRARLCPAHNCGRWQPATTSSGAVMRPP
jgi:hypothetical protein